MAGPGVADTSSYNQPAPASPLAVANQAVGLANNAQALKAGQFDLIQKQYGVMHNILGSMVSDPALTTEKVTGQIAHMAALGLITPQMAATESSQATQLGGDPAKLKALVQSHLVQSMSGADQFAQQYGTQTVDQGGTQSVQRVNKLTGQVSPMANGTFANGMSPGDANSTVTVTGADGVPHTMLKGQAAAFLAGQGGAGANAGNALGVSPGQGYTPPMPQGVAGQGVAMPNALGAAPPTPQAPAAPAAPAAPNALGAAPPVAAAPNAVAAIKAATSQPAAPAAPAPAAPAAAASAAIPGLAGPAPGAAEAAAKGVIAGAGQGAALQAAADAAPQTKATLSSLEADLAKFTSGPNSEKWNTLKAGANAAADIAGLPEGARFSRESIAAQENFKKQATLLAQQQAGALGGTDAGLASAGHSVPNLDFSNMGNRQIIQVLKGNQDAIAAKNGAWNDFKKANGANADFGTFQSQFNQTYEPRAYQFPYMSPAERTAMIKAMPAPERAQFMQNVEAAESKGYIKPNAGMNPGGGN